jgi:hypothetical protein
MVSNLRMQAVITTLGFFPAALRRNANFAVYLGSADTRTVACPRVDYDNWALLEVCGMFGWGLDAHECIIGRVFEGAPIHNYILIEDEDGRLAFLLVLNENNATPAHHVPEQPRTLPRVRPVGKRLSTEVRRRPRAKSFFRCCRCRVVREIGGFGCSCHGVTPVLQKVTNTIRLGCGFEKWPVWPTNLYLKMLVYAELANLTKM